MNKIKAIAPIIILTLNIIIVPIINGEFCEEKYETCDQHSILNKKNDGTFLLKNKFAFIIGIPSDIIDEGDKLVIRSGGCNEIHLFFPLPELYLTGLGTNVQIKISPLYFGSITENFIVAFCRVYLPKSDVSMHVSSNDDAENKVVFTVDQIKGDPVWIDNIWIQSSYVGGLRYYRPNEGYLQEGDQFEITADNDGYQYITFSEHISGDILYRERINF